MDMWLRDLNRIQQGSSPAPHGINWGHLGYSAGWQAYPGWLYSNALGRLEALALLGQVAEMLVYGLSSLVFSAESDCLRSNLGFPASQETDASSLFRLEPRNCQCHFCHILSIITVPAPIGFKGRGYRLHLLMERLLNNLCPYLIH